jgi:hypothetical protein
MSNPKYPALKTVAGFYRILAGITFFFTFFLIIFSIVATFVSGTYIGGGFMGFLGNLLGAIFGSLAVIFIYGLIGFAVATLELAVAESLEVLMDIEANTRS